MYRLESSTDFIVDLSPLELGDTHSRAQSGSTHCAAALPNDRLAFLADAAGMLSAVLDVVGAECRRVHPSVLRRLPNGRRRLPTRPAGLLGRGRTVAGRAAGSAFWAQGRGHCGGDGQADANAGGHGRKVVAVEPVAGMRERLAAALTGVELLDAWPRRFHSMMPGFTPRRSGRRLTGSTAIGTDRDPSRRSRGRPGWQSSIAAAARASDSGSARGDPSPTRRSNARPPQRSLARRVRALAPLDSGRGGRAPECPAARPRGHSRARGPDQLHRRAGSDRRANVLDQVRALVKGRVGADRAAFRLRALRLAAPPRAPR